MHSDESRILTIERNLTNLTKQVSELDRLVTKAVVMFDAREQSSHELEITLRNIDNNVKSLTIQSAAGPMERHKEVQEIIDPMWKTIRKHEEKIAQRQSDIKIAVDESKASIRREARSHLLLFSILFSSIGAYAYVSQIKEIKEDIKNNNTRIEKHYDYTNKVIK